MHILLIHQAFAALDEAGGTRHHEMARFLVAQGHIVTIIASPVSYLTGGARREKIPWKSREEPEPGIMILRTYTIPALHKSFIHRVFSFFSFMFSSFMVGLGVRGIDLVWGTSPPIFQGVTAWLLARLKRVPFLFEVRDLWPAFAVAVGVLRNRMLIRLSEWLERFLYRRADRVVVNSPGFIQHVTSRGARFVELVPNGADPDMFKPEADGREFLAQHQLDNKFIAMYAGAHGLSNDLGVLLRAASQLIDRPDIQVVFVGDGKEKPDLLAQANQLQLKNVSFISSQPKSQMADVLAAADACIAILKPIELYRTTYPNKVFDYMAAGRAVILAIGGVICDVINQENAGVAVLPGDPTELAAAIRRLANDKDLTKALGAAGRIAVEKRYNRTIISKQFNLLLEDMVR
ncbi:MAG: glycosyltransferase family 4 protein [Bellilinea sp.]